MRIDCSGGSDNGYNFQQNTKLHEAEVACQNCTHSHISRHARGIVAEKILYDDFCYSNTFIQISLRKEACWDCSRLNVFLFIFLFAYISQLLYFTRIYDFTKIKIIFSFFQLTCNAVRNFLFLSYQKINDWNAIFGCNQIFTAGCIHSSYYLFMSHGKSFRAKTVYSICLL